MVNILEHIENHSHVRFFAHLDGNLGGTAVGEMGLAGGNAAESDGAAVVFPGAIQARAVAGRQLPLLAGCWKARGNNRPHGMNDIPGRQIVSPSDDRASGGYPAALQNIVALPPQLQPCGRMDGIVDAVVKRLPATESPGVCSIDDGIDLEARDIPLPDLFIFDPFNPHRTLVSLLRLQLRILRGKVLVAQRLRLPDIHQRPQQSLFAGKRPRHLGLHPLLLHQVAYAEIYVLNPVHTLA